MSVPGNNKARPARSLEFIEDATLGWRLSSIQIGRVWECAATSLLRAEISIANAAPVVRDASYFTITEPLLNSGGDTWSATATLKADSKIAVSLYAKVTARGFEFWFTLASTSTTIAVLDVEWPRFNLLPVGEVDNEYFAYGFYGGHVMPRAREYVLGAIDVSSPRDMPYMALYDSESKAIFYTMVDDEDGHAFKGEMIGQTTSTLFYWEHWLDRRYLKGADFSKSYRVQVESWRGLSVDGVHCHEDVIDRWRQWATHADRPWMVRGPWATRIDTSDYVRNSSLLWVWGAPSRTDYESYDDDLTRLKTHLASGGVAASDMFTTLYPWANVTFNEQVPDVFGNPVAVLDADLLATVVTLHAASIHCQFYSLPRWWRDQTPWTGDPALSPNSATFSVTDALGQVVLNLIAANLRTYSVLDKNGIPKPRTEVAGGQTAFLLDPIYPEVKYIIFYLLKYYVDHIADASEPRGWYLDTTPHFSLEASFNDAAALTPWTMQRETDAFNLLYATIRELYRSNISTKQFFSCEFPDFRVMHNVDYLHITETVSMSVYGFSVRSFAYAFARYTRIFNYALPPLYDVDVATTSVHLYPVCQALAMFFLETGSICVTSRCTNSAGIVVAAAIDGTHNLDQIWNMCKLLHETRAGFLKYFKGQQCREVGGTCNRWRADMLKQTQYESAFWLFFNGGQYHTCARAWKADDGDVGVLIFNTYRSTMPLSFHPAPASTTMSVTVELDTAVHNLPAGIKNLYSTNISTGVRTLITTFQHSVTVTRSVGPFSADMLEVSLS